MLQEEVNIRKRIVEKQGAYKQQSIETQLGTIHGEQQ